MSIPWTEKITQQKKRKPCLTRNAGSRELSRIDNGEAWRGAHKVIFMIKAAPSPRKLWNFFGIHTLTRGYNEQRYSGFPLYFEEIFVFDCIFVSCTYVQECITPELPVLNIPILVQSNVAEIEILHLLSSGFG